MDQSVTCNKCGALIASSYESKHRRFHSDFDDVEKKLKDVEATARRAARR
jgi:DNA-directed RNA polymerase subunit N (RpoN/RPB10)